MKPRGEIILHEHGCGFTPRGYDYLYDYDPEATLGRF